MRANERKLRKGDWIKVEDFESGLTQQGLIYQVTKTHISIKSRAETIQTEYRRKSLIVQSFKRREEMKNWWRYL